MIVKKRKKPLILLQLEALIRRLPKNHAKFPLVEKELMKRRAGYRGEQTADYYLSLLEEEKYEIFQDLRLQNQKYFFQMDTLLVADNFILIIEVKNISGTIHFDSLFNQLIRTIDGKEEGFQSPFSQLQNQKNHLSDWLLSHQFPLPPIETFVVISNPSTIIKPMNGSSPFHQKISHAVNLNEKIQRLENIYKKDFIAPPERKKLKRLLLKKHSEAKTSILDKFDLAPHELLTGVMCESCRSFTLEYSYGRWKCSHCQIGTKDAHLTAIEDYFLLINSPLTNKDFRKFTGLSSRNIATRILTSLKLPPQGTKKSTRYYPPTH